ncbi:DUF4835 family protein [bacterium]|nr:DUF4835 family protein [bacterium]
MNRFIMQLMVAIAGSFLLAGGLFAQRMVATVNIDMERLPQEHQNLHVSLENIVESYINEQEWAPDEYGYDFYMDVDIVFEEAKAISFENRYSAVIVVSNRADAQFSDKRWEFSIDPGIQLTYSEQFEPFRSLLDYYAQMLHGYEFDKIKKFGGDPYFQTARRITQAARFSSRYFTGWDKREEWVDEYLEDANDHYRYLNFLYYTGEWLYYDERDRETAKQYLLYAIKQFDRVPKKRLERFFDLNYYNYANALAEYKEFKALSEIASRDPEHADLYERLLDK